jgi:hypothetical protein
MPILILGIRAYNQDNYLHLECDGSCNLLAIAHFGGDGESGMGDGGWGMGDGGWGMWDGEWGIRDEHGVGVGVGGGFGHGILTEVDGSAQ